MCSAPPSGAARVKVHCDVMACCIDMESAKPVILRRHPKLRAMTSNGRLLGKMMRKRSGRRRSEKLLGDR